MLEHGFRNLGLRRVVARIDPANGASLRVARKLGMRFEREVRLAGYTHPDHLYVTDRLHSDLTAAARSAAT